MELREYLDIFKKQARWFWLVVFFSVVLAFVWQQSQPEKYQAILLLNIGREGSEETADYTYDNFYRLQADERFADTVVRWLGSPRVVEDIYGTAGFDAGDISVRGLKDVFTAKRLSSQMIEVAYVDAEAGAVRKISESMVGVLNTYAERLNQENKESNWFVVVGSDPVIRDARVSLSLAVIVGLVLGVFIGFWGALLRHYFRKQ